MTVYKLSVRNPQEVLGTGRKFVNQELEYEFVYVPIGFD